MKLIRNYLLYICLAATVCSCQDSFIESETHFPEGKRIEVPVHFQVEEEMPGDDSPLSRADVPIEESKLYDFWIFQFDGISEQSILITAPQYLSFTEGATVIPVIDSNASTHRLVFVANTGNAQIEWNMPAGSTYKDLLGKNRKIADQNSLLEGQGTLMCGSWEGVLKQNEAVEMVNLKRSIAKIALTLSVAEGSGLTVRAVSLGNVANSIYWCDPLFLTDDQEFPEENGLSIFTTDFSPTQVSGLTGGQSQNFVWYIPRNRRGTGNADNTESKKKNLYAPQNATYIRISATDADGNAYTYRVYPGADLTKDFNLLPGKRYAVSLKLTGKGDPEDSRVEKNYKTTRLDPSNCYLLNPPLPGMEARIYEIPLSRVNQFWGDNAYDVLRTSGSTNLSLTSNSQWACQILWCDNPNLYGAGDANYGDTSNEFMTIVKKTGIYPTDAYVQIRLPGTNQYGNMLIGVYKDNNKNGIKDNDEYYCWSWHLWVTDYNPNQLVSIDPKKFVYPVQGGQVERYGSALWGYVNGQYETPNPNYSPYKESVMLDREIGTINKRASSPMFYQYGRKDPFYGRKQIIYGANKEIISRPKQNGTSGVERFSYTTASAANEKATMWEAITNPTLLYIFSSSSSNWLQNSTKSGFFNDIFTLDGKKACYIWNDLKLQDKNHQSFVASEVEKSPDNFKKSIFDPCPQGWMIPYNSSQSTGNISYGTWTDFNSSIFSNINVKVNGFQIININNMMYYGTFGQGIYYWPGAKNKAPIKGVIFYPIVGSIDYKGNYTLDEGATSYPRTCRWTNHPFDLTDARSILINEVNNQQPSAKAYAYPVRCVKEGK